MSLQADRQLMMPPDHQPQSLPTYGGQAVIEGVMMRGRSSCKVAVRTPDSDIQVEDLPLSPIYRSRWATLPFLRGLLVLWDALGLGMRALTFSANVQGGEDANIEGAPMFITMAISLLFGVGLFFLLPAGGAYLVQQVTPLTSGWVNLIEGLVRLLLLVGYIWGIGLMPDIQRVYGYHGAEHMTINAFEAGADLRVESVRQYSRQHAALRHCLSSHRGGLLGHPVQLSGGYGPSPAPGQSSSAPAGACLVGL